MLAAENGHIALVELLIARGADPAIGDSKHGRNALHRAVAKGHSRVVDVLLDVRAGLVRETSRVGTTALHIAAARNDVRIATRLVEAGAPLDARARGGPSAKETPCGTARRLGFRDLEAMLQGEAQRRRNMRTFQAMGLETTSGVDTAVRAAPSEPSQPVLDSGGNTPATEAAASAAHVLLELDHEERTRRRAIDTALRVGGRSGKVLAARPPGNAPDARKLSEWRASKQGSKVPRRHRGAQHPSKSHHHSRGSVVAERMKASPQHEIISKFQVSRPQTLVISNL